MPWRPVLLPQERTAHLSSTLKTLSWRAALAKGTDRGRPHHLCSRGNGVWGGSQEVKVQMGRVAGGGGRSSFEVSIAMPPISCTHAGHGRPQTVHDC